MQGLLQMIRSQPIGRLPARARARVLRQLAFRRQRSRDRSRTTHISDEAFLAHLGGEPGSLEHVLQFPSRFADTGDITTAAMRSPADAGFREVARAAAGHRFALLGSALSQVSYESRAPGAFGAAYPMTPGRHARDRQLGLMAEMLEQAAVFTGDASPEHRTLRERLDGYEPIDWHVDFKSGYRWDPATWWFDIPVGRSPGADVKVPWELSRSHHLVALALDAVAGDDEEDRSGEVSAQLLDWIAANPPRFGVNWRSAMDVAIRAANWLWALALLGEKRVPPSVRWLAAKSLYQHGVHVAQHLDYLPRGTNNHYLADIAGILHITAAFPDLPEAPAWAALGLQELHSELERTLCEDGASYEGSTGYHRLVAETFLHGSMAALRLPLPLREAAKSARTPGRSLPAVRPRDWTFDPGSEAVFPRGYWSRLRAAVAFTAGVTKPNGLVPQFGDQDSGRFLKFDWPGTHDGDGQFIEDPADHRHLLSLGQSSGGTLHPVERAAGSALRDRLIDFPPKSVKHARDGESAADWYPNGGVCVLQSGPFWVAVRCLHVEQQEPSGHRHNDQLSVELNFAGIDFVIDPGSGVYTADPALRNALRATDAHSTVAVPGSEQNPIPDGLHGLFTLHDHSNAAAIAVEAGRFSGEHSGFGATHRRTVAVIAGEVTIEDELALPGRSRVVFALAPGVEVDDQSAVSGEVVVRNGGVSLAVSADRTHGRFRVEDAPVAPRYGLAVRSNRLVFERDTARTVLRFRVDGAVH